MSDQVLERTGKKVNIAQSNKGQNILESHYHLHPDGIWCKKTVMIAKYYITGNGCIIKSNEDIILHIFLDIIRSNKDTHLH